MSDKLINPGKREGTVLAPSSKSMAHRHLICAALSGRKTVIRCEGVSKDIKATALCLSAMGADIKMTADPDNERITLIEVDPVGICNYQEQKCPDDPGSNTGAELTDITKMTGILLCEESGSTLRFLLPLAGALGLNASFEMKGRLPDRPMDEYETILKQHGMNISRKGNMLNCSGRLCSGDYELAGNISSQYFSGLLFSLPLLNGESRIITKGALESADYFEMTKDVVRKAGITWSEIDNVMTIPGGQHYDSPGDISVEGDYSSAAFFLCAGALSDFGICVTGLEPDSIQGDRSICQILKQFGAMVYVLPGKKAVFVQKGKLKGTDVDASMIPDLIPVLSVVAALSEGTTRIYNAHRLRMKESDRLKSTADMLTALGADVHETDDGLVITGKSVLYGGVKVDPVNDHRIAMAAAIAAGACEKGVTIMDAQCVEKSYPAFWDDLASVII